MIFRSSALPPDPLWLTPYRPIAIFRGGHAQTLLGNFWLRASLKEVAEAESVVVDEADQSRILCHCHWQRDGQTRRVLAERLTVLIVHGLEGSSNSGYVCGITALALQAGCNVIRMNMRNCGDTDAWTPTLYHSARSDDVTAVVHHFQQKHHLTRMAMIGYSMGGNLVLKLAGEVGSDAPEWMVAAAVVSPVTDLAESADALHERSNRIYERNFLKRLRRRFRRKAQLFPERYSRVGLPSIRSIRDFDNAVTAPHSGFSDADDYYFRASSARRADAIRIPTLILNALDDPFIRMRADTRQKLWANQAVRLIETQHGGHCAFLARRERSETFHRHWAERTVTDFVIAAASMATERWNGS